MADLDGFDERYPLNSRLVKQDGALVEEVYRIGGKYDTEIRAIVRHLEAAIPYATAVDGGGAAGADQVLPDRRDGGPRGLRHRVGQDQDSPVDTINGFVEVYMDARGIKGAWEALVYYVNPEKTEGIRTLADERAVVRGPHALGRSVQETGRARRHRQRHRRRRRDRRLGPITPIGINLPNDQDDPRAPRQQVGVALERQRGVRQVDAAGVPPRVLLDAGRGRARARSGAASPASSRPTCTRSSATAPGKVAERLNGSPQSALKEQYSALEEARADLVALYFVPDPKLVELGLVAGEDHAEIVRAEYEGYARNALVQLRRVREGTQIEEDHMRNRQMIVHWLMANSNAIEVRRRDGKTYYVMVDAQAFREGVGRLLADVQRIKAEGDYDAAQAAVRDVRHPFRRRPARRGRRARRAPEHAVLHGLRPAAARSGDRQRRRRSQTSSISYPLDLKTQMLEYSGRR